MINQQLVNFIRQQLHAGMAKEKITKDLLSGDWNEQDIKEGFEAIIDIPVPEIGVAESTINSTIDKNLNQVELHTQILNQPTTPFSVVSQKEESKQDTIIEEKKEPIAPIAIPVSAQLIQTETLTLNSNLDSIAVINQKLNPSLHFHQNVIPDLDFSKDVPIVANNPINILEKPHTKGHFNKKIFFIILIVFLLIIGLIFVYYFKDNLKDLPIINYFNK